MGLNVSDFDIITLKQFRIMQRIHRKNFEYEKEVDSLAVLHGMYNYHRKRGTKYEKIFAHKTKKKTVEELELEMEELF